MPGGPDGGPEVHSRIREFGLQPVVVSVVRRAIGTLPARIPRRENHGTDAPGPAEGGRIDPGIPVPHGHQGVVVDLEEFASLHDALPVVPIAFP